MKRKLLASFLSMIIMFSWCLPTYAKVQGPEIMVADYSKANAKLDCNFRIKGFGNDDATAKTWFTESNGNYIVAVRLEAWDTSKGITDFKYKQDSYGAVAEYSRSDVYCYWSRHSINPKNDQTREVAIKTYHDID